MNRLTKTLQVLSILLVVITLGVSVAGIVFPSLYQDNPTFVLIWQSNDIVTLLVALPLFMIGMVSYLKAHSIKALMVWMSMIWYLVYNYAYYVYGAAFNALYLGHLAIYSIGIMTIILALVDFPIALISSPTKLGLSHKVVIGEMIFVATGLSMIYILQSLLFAFTGVLPAIITASGHVTSVVFTIDMSMVVVFFILSVILMLKKHPWGFVIAFIANLKGVIYMGVLTFASLRTNPAEAPIWITLGTLTLIATILLIRYFPTIKEPEVV